MVNKYIKNDLENRKITCLTHFTHVSNLESILNNGLLSVKTLDNENINFKRNDSKRLDGRLNATCLSISFPNYKMFYKYQNDHTDMVVLLIHPSVILHKKCLFCSENAAKKSIRFLSDEYLRSNDAWDSMFELQSDGITREKLNIPLNYPTNPQAEILCLETIESSYITGITYDSDRELTLPQPHPKTYNDKFFHSPRFDYKHW